MAFVDYDNDGWLDIFFVNGTRFEAAYAPGQAPVSRLYKNNRDGTFTDVTVKAGVARTGWGQGVCVGDYNNDGHEDIFVTYWGDCALWRNNGDGTFTDVAAKAGVTTDPGNGQKRWNTGCAFLDYDRDGHLDLFITNYIDFDPKTTPLPESGSIALQRHCWSPARSLSPFEGRQEHSVSQQGRRHVYGREREIRHSEYARHVRARSAGGGFR